MYNAALRPAATRYSLRLSSTLRSTARLNSTQGFVMYNATNSAPHRPSLHRLNSLLSLSLLSTAQLNDLFVNLSPLNAPRRAALLLNAPRFNSTQFNSTICLSI